VAARLDVLKSWFSQRGQWRLERWLARMNAWPIKYHALAGLPILRAISLIYLVRSGNLRQLEEGPVETEPAGDSENCRYWPRLCGPPPGGGALSAFSGAWFDVDHRRLVEVEQGYDRTREVDWEELIAAQLELSSEPSGLRGCDLFIVTVPTPVDANKQPDLSAVIEASRTVGSTLNRGAVVVYESTVYPGVTEDICGPVLEEVSRLTAGQDFFLGYSPERINPGDRTHALDRITKVVAGQTPEVTDYLEGIYGKIIEAGVFRAANIRTAEAAKVIENAQRDINIAFINEVTQIFSRMDLSIYEVLEAARTKWNFLDFRPGMVGGHCIGVDPY